MGITITGFEEISDFIKQLQKTTNKNLNEGLSKATDFLVGQLENNTPSDSGRTKKSWVAEKKYNNVKYINNISTNKKGIPIVNLLEYAKNGKPFVRKTVTANESTIEQIITNSLDKTGDEF